MTQNPNPNQPWYRAGDPFPEGYRLNDTWPDSLS